MKTLKGKDFNLKTEYFSYEINGKQYWVQGELYYNKGKERFEHIHIGSKGGEYLIVWNYKL